MTTDKNPFSQLHSINSKKKLIFIITNIFVRTPLMQNENAWVTKKQTIHTNTDRQTDTVLNHSESKCSIAEVGSWSSRMCGWWIRVDTLYEKESNDGNNTLQTGLSASRAVNVEQDSLLLCRFRSLSLFVCDCERVLCIYVCALLCIICINTCWAQHTRATKRYTKAMERRNAAEANNNNT